MAAAGILKESDAATIRTEYGDFKLRCFIVRDKRGTVERELILAMGTPRDGMLVRINSSCITSETFGDQNCDCHSQLRISMRAIAAEQRGLIVHAVHEEGRGIGIFDKINSMAIMQRSGCTSAEAFRLIKRPVDCRTYEHAAIVIKHLGIKTLRLLSNNSQKKDVLTEHGVNVINAGPLMSDSFGGRPGVMSVGAPVIPSLEREENSSKSG